MADRTLVKNYIRDAKAAVGTGIAAQIEWLETTHRAPLSQAVSGGDIEVTSRSFEGVASASRRGISAKARLDAVIAAIEALELLSGEGTSAGRPTVLGFRINNITG